MSAEINKRLGIQVGQKLLIGIGDDFGIINEKNSIAICIETSRFNNVVILDEETATKFAKGLLEAADCTVEIMPENEVPFDLADRFEIKHNTTENQWYLVLYGKDHEMALKCSLRDIHKLKEQLEVIL